MNSKDRKAKVEGTRKFKMNISRKIVVKVPVCPE
jgi:hypothetical protein